jgi:hypothetical protein
MSIGKPTLIVHTTYFRLSEVPADWAFDPERKGAEDLGRDLYNLLTRRIDDPLSWGAGVPVRIATQYDRIDPDEATYTVVVPVLGPDLHADEQLRVLALQKIAEWQNTTSRVLPVPTSPVWRANETVKLVQGELLDGRAATLDEIVLAIARVIAGDGRDATRLFISHAKVDLQSTGRAAEKIRDHVLGKTTSEKPFFDSVSLLAGEDLDTAIDAQAGRGVFIAVRGDSYSSRSWCMRELLKAKRHRLPMLTVEVLTMGERRSSAYSGNGPTVVWHRDSDKPEAAVVTQAMVECVRSLLFMREAERVARTTLTEGAAIQMPRAPELLDVASLRGTRDGVIVVIHPDPELSVHERAVLEEADKRLRLVTPTTAFAGAIGRAHRAPLDGWQVALSLSDDPGGSARDGLTNVHVQDVTVFLARTLVSAGAAIAYGGDFRKSGYTELLAQLVSAYNQTASKPADLLHSYLPAMRRRPASWTFPYTAHDLGRFGNEKAAAMLTPPTGDTDIPLDRVALYQSDMRRLMALRTDARICVSGKTVPKAKDRDGYSGRYPGVVEEAWWTLQVRKPLYVVGGFGGAAALIADLLEGRPLPAELDETTLQQLDAWKSLASALDKDGDVERLGVPRTQLQMADQIRARATELLADSVKWNGLTLDENRTLWRSRDPLTITGLVLKGLICVAAHDAHGKLRIELVEGDVTGASDLDVLVFPTFTDLDPDGAGAALDAVTAGAATRAHRSHGPVSPATRSVGADFLYAADLGTMSAATADVTAHVEDAARQTTEMARRYGFKRVGVVTFMGNVAANLAEVVGAMLRGFAGLMTGQELVWFERDPARAALLASILAAVPNVDFTHVVAEQATPPEQPRINPRTIIQVQQQGDEVDVTLLLPQANGLAPKLRPQVTAAERGQLAGDAYAAAPPAAALEARGNRIAELLFGSDSTRVLEAVRDTEIVIIHDAASSGLPYETLGWGAGPQRITPATRGGLRRHLLADVPADRGVAPPAHMGQLGVLLIVDPRGDLPNAAVEGRAIHDRLARNLRVKVELLQGAEATVDAVIQHLQNPTTDIVHYCGHAFYHGSGPDQSGLNLASDGMLTVAQLAQLSRVPRLAVFNACQAGRVRGGADVRPPQSFAEYFLRAGVDAYVGTFWLVSDDGAARFAEDLYDQLSEGTELGEAVVHARAELQKALCNDWANYVMYGRGGFRLVRGAGIEPPASRAVPVPDARVEGNTIVASWSFDAASAPATFGVTVTEWFAAPPGQEPADEVPVETSSRIAVDRRDRWQGTLPIVQWVATVPLQDSADGRAFRLRPTAGSRIDVGTPTKVVTRTRGPEDPVLELKRLRTILDQQPDGGLAILDAILPSSDPLELRVQIDSVLDTRAIWPFNSFTTTQVDDDALAAFVAAYKLPPLDHDTVADQHFQTKEDWARYASARGGAWFMIGGEVDRPLTSEMMDATNRSLLELGPDLTTDTRPGELKPDGITVAMFSDNGNGLYASRAIARQVVDSNLPYAFHLGDVYYGGTPEQFQDYFAGPLEPMLDRTELFMLTGNHEMFGKGTEFNRMVRAKAQRASGRQRQRAETFRLRGPGFQMIGLDTMFIGWRDGRMRLHDYADDDALRLLDSWLRERPDDLTILMTTNEAWDFGSRTPTRLYDSLRTTIAGRVDLWFWGNVHYAALYDPWTFADTGSPRRQMITTCIGHGGYPFYTEDYDGKLPPDVHCRWKETKSRFWPEQRVRPDVGLNGWCRMNLAKANNAWTVTLTYLDWIGRERLRAQLVRPDGESIRFASVQESDIATVGGPPTWNSR